MSEASLSTLGERIDAARAKQSLSHNDIASRMQLSRGAVAQWIANRTSPSLDKVTQLASILDVDPSWLAFGLEPGEQRVIYVDRPEQSQEERAAQPPVSAPVPDGVMVGIPEVDFNAFDQLTEKHVWWLPVDVIRHEWRGSLESTVIMEAEDDMMSPTMVPGDFVVVDRSRTKVWPPGVFAVWNGVAVTFQRLEVIPNSDLSGEARCRVRYDNDDHPPTEAAISTLRIVGRCVGRVCRLS